jgi:ubiquinol-cytochrome c reductase cytochrome b subunit
LGFFYVFQIITGLLLAINYVPEFNSSFESVAIIDIEMKYGLILHSMHIVGASFIFILMYLHILKGFIFESYLKPRTRVWLSGSFIYLLTMLIAFIGYVLPLGQMGL